MDNQTNSTKQNAKSLNTLLQTKQATMIISLVLAFIIWLIVVTTIDPATEKTMPVTVDFSFNEAAYTSQGLSIVEKPSLTLNVAVEGDGIELASLLQSDLIAYPDYSSVKGSGTYTLPLAVNYSGSGNVNIKDNDFGYITLTFDKLITIKHTISVNVTGVEVIDGYYMDLPVTSSTEVTLSGPESAIAPIKSVVATVVLEEQRTESAIVNTRLDYLDENGNIVSSSDITTDVDQVEVTIPIYPIKEVPLSIEFTGVPTGYDPTVLGATLSEKTIRIAGPEAQIEGITSVNAGAIDLSTFVLGEEIISNIVLPENIRNVDGLQTVTVYFDTQGYSTQTVTVTEFSIINLPDGVEITFPTGRINTVRLVGEDSELTELSDTSVVAVIDAANLTVVRGQQNIPAQIIVSSTDTVFATGKYSILCEVEQVETDE